LDSRGRLFRLAGTTLWTRGDDCFLAGTTASGFTRSSARSLAADGVVAYEVWGAFGGVADQAAELDRLLQGQSQYVRVALCINKVHLEAALLHDGDQPGHGRGFES
jgi:hypothetical protein